MKKSVLTVSAILLCCLALPGCSLRFGLRKEVKAAGEVGLNSARADAERLTVKDIYIKTGTTTGGPKVELLSDGGAARVEVEAQASLLEEIKIGFSGGNLTVSANKNKCYVTSEPVILRLYNYSFEKLGFSGACGVTDNVGLGREGKKLEVELSGASSLTSVSMKGDTVSVSLSGASRAESLSLQVDTLKLDVSGASSFHCPDAAVMRRSEWDISGASRLEIAGTGRELKAEISGASRAESLDFEQEGGKVEISGASTLEGSFSGKLSGSASGASHLYYKGEASVDVKTSGASDVKKK